MAISPVPYALQDVTHPAALFRQASSSLVPPGGGIINRGDLTVSQTGTASMAVVVGVGRIWIPGTEEGNVTGGNFSTQSMYYAENEAATTVTVATANANNPRIDVVYVSVNDQAYSGTLNQAKIGIVTGTPNATPVAPGLPNNAVALANVAVAANASSIITANITNLLGAGLVDAMPKGALFASVVSATTGAISSRTVVNNISTVTFTGGRKYRLQWEFSLAGTANSQYIVAEINTCATTDAAGSVSGLTQLQTRTVLLQTSGSGQSGICTAIYMPATTVTKQVKFTSLVVVGGGTVAMSAQNFTVEDLGAQF